MKIKIAICDDEQKLCSQLEELLIKLLEEKHIKYEIDVFTFGENLCEEMERTEYDLIFLDIELPKMNGVQIGTYIREVKRNEVVQIAYISAKQGYAMELFDTRPINFLVKPLEREKLEKVLHTYIKINGGKTEVFSYKKGFSICKTEIYKIKYFVREGRKVIMHTLEGEVEFYASMEKIYETVKTHGFLFIHKSYMINHRYIKKLSYDKVLMTDDMELPISQARRKEVRALFMQMEEE